MADRGLRPVLESIEGDGCPVCGQEALIINVNGPDEIGIRPCGHVVDTMLDMWGNNE